MLGSLLLLLFALVVFSSLFMRKLWDPRTAVGQHMEAMLSARPTGPGGGPRVNERS